MSRKGGGVSSSKGRSLLITRLGLHRMFIRSPISAIGPPRPVLLRVTLLFSDIPLLLDRVLVHRFGTISPLLFPGVGLLILRP